MKVKSRWYLVEQRGVTLTELLVTLAILWVVIGSIYGLLEVGYASYSAGEKQMDAQMNARLAIDRMVNELRQAREANNGAFAIATTSSDTITFYADVDKSSTGSERVRYFVPGDGEAHEHELRRGITPSSGNPPVYKGSDEVVTTVAKYIQNGDVPIFTYYSKVFGGSGDPLQAPVNPLDVTLIRIRLVVDVNPGEVPQEFNLESNVQLRNLKTNLGD